MLLRRSLNLAASLIAGVLGGCMAPSVALAPSPVTLATGSPGGIFHPVGSAICRMFNLPGQPPEAPCVALSSDGAVENIRRVQGGESSFGLSQTDVAYAAYHGEGPFAPAKVWPFTFGGGDQKLRVLMALYPGEFTVVARADSGIRDFQDLRDKRIGVGVSGAGYTFTRDVILKYYNWTITDSERLLELGAAEQNDALCSDKVDAIVFVDGHPSGLTQEATAGCDANLVRVAGPRIDQLLAAYRYYEPSIIPGGMYDGNPNDVPTIGTRAILITTSNVPDDLAYGLVKAVFENFDDFRRLHPALRYLKLEDMVPSSAVLPIHPGALKYFREAGLQP
jgi:uncharacterized protein